MQNINKLRTLNRSIAWLITIYLLFRLPKLTLLPIFNDESIYLDWGWRMTHVPGFLYYSLYDAKQPFTMWLFGIFINFFPDPLFAGRFVSLLLGLLTLTGIYFLGKSLFNKRVGFVASITYTIIPIFVLFDRQALLESAISASGVWGLYFVTKALKGTRSVKSELLAGLSIGLGFFSKSSALLFLLPTLIIFIKKYSEKDRKSVV